MKLTTKITGLCACSAVILTIYTGVFNGMAPLEIISLAIPGAALASFFGYQIGDILSKPKGNPHKRSRKKAEKKQSTPQAEPIAPITGNETFLSDLETPLIEENSPLND